MSLFGTGRREGLLAMLLLVVLAVAQHGEGVLAGRPRTPLGNDGGSQCVDRDVLLPAWSAVGQAVRQGSSPLWNPSNRFGEPAQFSGADLCYPPYWLLALDASDRTLEFLRFAHVALAALLMFRLLRRLSMSRYVAFLGAATWSLGWPALVAGGRIQELAAMTWLPLVLECAWACVFRSRTPARAVALGAAILPLCAAGSPAIAALGGILTIALVIFGTRLIDREDRAATLWCGALGGLVAALLTAPIWLHVLQHADVIQLFDPDLTRGVSATALLAGSVQPGALGELPPTSPSVPHAMSMDAVAVYPGALALFAGVLALLRPKRTPHGPFWLITGGLPLIIAADGPWNDWLSNAEVRPPTTAALTVAHLCLVVLVSRALENFFDAPQARAQATPIAAGAAIVGGATMAALSDHTPFGMLPGCTLAAIGLSFTIWRRIGILRFKDLLATVVIAECVLAAWATVPRTQISRDAEQVASMLPDGARTITMRGSINFSRNQLVAHGAQVVDTQGRAILGGTSKFLRRLRSGAHSERPGVTAVEYAHRLATREARWAGIETVIAPRNTTIEGYSTLLAAPAAATRPSGLDVLVADEPAPRAWIDHSAPEANSEVSWRSTTTTLQELDVSSDEGGLLVTTEAFAPGWFVTVDGEPAELHQHLDAFRAVAVPPGDHIVRFRYAPWSWRFGIPTFGVGVILAIGLLLFRPRRR